MKKLVTIPFRDYCFNKYPNLEKKLSYRYLFNYLCFGSFFDKDSSRLIISSRILASFERIEYDHHYNSLAFLNDFKQNILNEFEWSNPDINKQKPRMVINYGFNNELISLINKELSDFDKTNKIYFTNGEFYKRIRNKVKIKNIENDYVYNESQKIILNYLQDIEPMTFVKKIKANKDLIDYHISLLDEELKNSQRKIIASFMEEPKIIYTHSQNDRTPRLFASGSTILSLKSNIRKAVCCGWTDFDLRSSQFCILSEILDAPISKEFIKNNGNIWEYMNYNAFGDKTPPSKELKRIFKEIIYGICFGESSDRIKQISEIYNASNILDCDIIKELLQKRKIWFREIRKNGGVYDVWGNFIKLNKNVEDKKDYRWEGSVAACKIQSIELEIMRSLFDFANENDKSMQFKIVLFQHDGICCSFYNKSKKDRIIEKMKQVVRDKSKSMGYSIELTAEDL